MLTLDAFWEERRQSQPNCKTSRQTTSTKLEAHEAPKVEENNSEFLPRVAPPSRCSKSQRAESVFTRRSTGRR
jgi:hypothetical protein